MICWCAVLMVCRANVNNNRNIRGRDRLDIRLAGV